MHFIVSLLALLLIIAYVFNINIKTLLILIGLFIGGIFLIHKIGIIGFFTVIGIIIAILIIISFVSPIYLQQKRKKNLEKPLINEKYGRCKNCMSPNISLLKKEKRLTGYQNQTDVYSTIFYCKCNDCSLEFINRERDGIA